MFRNIVHPARFSSIMVALYNESRRNTVLTMSELDLQGQRVLIRADLNVPMEAGKISNTRRIDAELPTLKRALTEGAAVILLSHLGRPQEGEYDARFSLAPAANYLSSQLNQEVALLKDWLGGVDVAPGQLVLCENVRFNVGEKANDPVLAKNMAALCDVFVMDAFGAAHRAHASTAGVAAYAAKSCAGPLLTAEIKALNQVVRAPQRPLLAIVGGSKVSTKLDVLQSLLNQVDQLIVGGGIANTFIAAAGYPVGASLYEKDLVATATQLMEQAKTQQKEILIPNDVMVAQEFSATAAAEIKQLDDVNAADMILDCGPNTMAHYAKAIHAAKTILWNGPVGVFEFANFAAGTQSLAEAIAKSEAFSVAGGGDTLAAIDQFAVAEHISYISTGGGAFLEFIEGKKLPGIESLT